MRHWQGSLENLVTRMPPKDSGPPSRDSYGPARAFWARKRVFVTGHTGFKGSWLVLWLSHLGAEIHGYALEPPTKPSLFDELKLAELCTHETGDVRDADHIHASLHKFHPDIVLHLAAQPLVLASYAMPAETFAVNVHGTVNVMEAARKAGPRAVLVITTDKCYLNRERTRPYTEDEALGGDDPYSASKGCAELAVRAWQKSFFNEKQNTVLGSARAGNIFGGGDWGDNRILPDAARAFSTGKPLIVRHPEAIRPWQHVTAPLCGYLMLAERMFSDGHAYAIPFNFGPDGKDHLTVRQLVSVFTKCWGKPAAFEEQPDPSAPHEATYLSLDSTRAIKKLGWRPPANLANDLQGTADLYKLLLKDAPFTEKRAACIAMIAKESGASRADRVSDSRVA